MKSVTAIIHKGEKFYVGECIEVDVVTQGETIDEALKNLKEALALYFEDEDPDRFHLPEEAPLMVRLGVDECVTS